MSRVFKDKDNQVTQKYKKGYHDGIDLVGYKYALDYITAHSDGVVVSVRSNYKTTDKTGSSYGNYVKIKHSNYYTLYAHMKYGSVTVKVGDTVKKGQTIGYMGSTGRSTGAHLHFEVRNAGDVKIDPTPYIDADFTSDTSTTNEIEYRVHIKGGNWLSWVKKADNTNEGYAGIYGKSIDGIQVKNRVYQAHTIGGSWLSKVTKVDTTSSGYAGIWNKSIDGIKIENAKYRVHIKGGSWLDWVSKVDNTSNGYAGLYGKEIDGVQIKSL